MTNRGINDRKGSILIFLTLMTFGLFQGVMRLPSTLAVTVLYQDEPNFSDPVLISSESINGSTGPDIVIDAANNIHVSWLDQTNLTGSNPDATQQDVFSRNWINETETWTSTEVVSSTSNDSIATHAIGVDGFGNVHAVWAGQINGPSDEDIFYRMWNATSASWQDPVFLVDNTGTSDFPAVAGSNAGDVFVAWRDNTDYQGAGIDYDIFGVFYNGTTKTWGSIEVLSNASLTGFSTSPAVAFDSNRNVYVVWSDNQNMLGAGTDYDIFCIERYAATNGTWSAIELVSDNTGASYAPSIAAGPDGNVHVVWSDDTNFITNDNDFDIFYRMKAANGAWNDVKLVSTESTGNAYQPDVTVDSAGTVHVCWADSTDINGWGTDTDVFYKAMPSNRTIFTPVVMLSNWSTADSGYPNIAAYKNGTAVITWADYSDYGISKPNPDVYVISVYIHFKTQIIPDEDIPPNGDNGALPPGIIAFLLVEYVGFAVLFASFIITEIGIHRRKLNREPASH